VPGCKGVSVNAGPDPQLFPVINYFRSPQGHQLFEQAYHASLQSPEHRRNVGIEVRTIGEVQVNIHYRAHTQSSRFAKSRGLKIKSKKCEYLMMCAARQ
jgi:hypothetical protein